MERTFPTVPLPPAAIGRPRPAAGVPRVLIALMAAGVLAACGSDPAASDPDMIESAPVEVGGSFAGNYLAGRHAQAERDMGQAADYLKVALEKDPDNPDLLRRAFVLLVADGRMEDASALARRLLAVQEKAPVAKLAVIVDAIRAGNFAPAESHLDDMSDSGIYGFMTPLLKAWIRVGRGQTDEALAALAALADKPGFQALHDMHAGLIDELAGRIDAARTLYQAAADNPNGLTLRLTEILGGLHERAGETDAARTLYQGYQDDHPGTHLLDSALARLKTGKVPPLEVSTAADGVAEALFGIASSLRQQSARETALVFGRMALYLRPDFPMQQILVADILENDDQLVAANQVYGAIDPNSPFAWSARLRVATNLDDLGETEDAIRRLRQMAAERPDDTEALITVGDILRSKERFAEAVAAYDAAAARVPAFGKQHWTLLYARGIALERSKKWERAERDFLAALAFEPDQPYVLNYLGYSWVDQGRNLDRAKAMIERAVELRPNDGYIVDSLGWALYRLGDYPGAARELERAVELRPEDPVINDHLGDAYWWVRRHAEARFQWRRALGFDPEPDVRERIEKKLRDGLVDKAPAGQPNG